jgi:Domain of unknown function (DUF3474)
MATQAHQASLLTGDGRARGLKRRTCKSARIVNVLLGLLCVCLLGGSSANFRLPMAGRANHLISAEVAGRPVFPGSCPSIFPLQEVDLSQAPPFTLADLKNAIPAHCFKRKPARSMAYLVRDVAVVLGMAVAAHAVNAW